MDYRKIVLEGYNNNDSRQNLDSYFFRQWKNAEKEFYSVKEFFDGCLSQINSFKTNIEVQKNQDKGQFESWLRNAKNRSYPKKAGETDEEYNNKLNDLIDHCEKEIPLIEKHVVRISCECEDTGPQVQPHRPCGRKQEALDALNAEHRESVGCRERRRPGGKPVELRRGPVGEHLRNHVKHHHIGNRQLQHLMRQVVVPRALYRFQNTAVRRIRWQCRLLLGRAATRGHT